MENTRELPQYIKTYIQAINECALVDNSRMTLYLISVLYNEILHDYAMTLCNVNNPAWVAIVNTERMYLNAIAKGLFSQETKNIVANWEKPQ